MEERKRIVNICKQYRERKLLRSLDLRSSTDKLQSELTRLGYTPTIGLPPIPPTPTQPIADLLFYNVYSKLPIAVLLRLHSQRVITDVQFWMIRLTRVLPRELVPDWIGEITTLRGYAMMRMNEVIGKVYVIGGSYRGRDKRKGNAYLKPHPYKYLNKVRIINESGEFNFVDEMNNIYTFNLIDHKSTFFRIPLPESRSREVIKSVGCNDFSAYLMKSGELFMKGKYHSICNSPNKFIQFPQEHGPILDVDLSSSHLFIKTIDKYLYGGYESPLNPLKVPNNAFKIISGVTCFYCLTSLGEIYVIGTKCDILGIDLQGREKIQTWEKIVLPPITKIQTNNGRTLALTVEGKVYGWGTFKVGEFGFPLNHTILIPQIVYEKERIIDIDVSNWRMTMLTERHTLIIYGAYEAKLILNPGGQQRVRLSNYLTPKLIQNVKLARSVLVGTALLM